MYQVALFLYASQVVAVSCWYQRVLLAEIQLRSPQIVFNWNESARASIVRMKTWETVNLNVYILYLSSSDNLINWFVNWLISIGEDLNSFTVWRVCRRCQNKTRNNRAKNSTSSFCQMIIHSVAKQQSRHRKSKTSAVADYRVKEVKK